MKTQTIDANRNPRKPRILTFFLLLTLLLTSCSSSVPVSQTLEPTTNTEVQPQVGSHPPVILRTVEHEEVKNGYVYIYYDIYFTDSDGDAVATTYRVVSSTLSFGARYVEDPIEVPAQEQKGEALTTFAAGRCSMKMELGVKSRIRDQAGNLSEPALFTVSCTIPPAVDTRSFLVRGLIMSLPIAMILLLGFWLLFRRCPEERLPALRSTILIFFLFMLLRFLQLVLHEGGHSLYPLVRGVPITLYVHPFIFSGFSRPIIDSGIWYDILGSATAIPVGLLFILLFWKRRSLILLPWVMLPPYIALVDGFNVMGMIGDFWNAIIKPCSSFRLQCSCKVRSQSWLRSSLYPVRILISSTGWDGISSTQPSPLAYCGLWSGWFSLCSISPCSVNYSHGCLPGCVPRPLV
jgi:hypothetical protein